MLFKNTVTVLLSFLQKVPVVNLSCESKIIHLIFQSKLLKNIKSVKAGIEVYSSPSEKKKKDSETKLINF